MSEVTNLVLTASVEQAMDDLSARILRDSKIIAAADRVANAAQDYVVASVERILRSEDYEEVLREFVVALDEYRELRGMKS